MECKVPKWDKNFFIFGKPAIKIGSNVSYK